MHTATLDLLKRYYTAFNTGDVDSFLALLTDDVVHDINQGESEIGRVAFKAFMQRMNACYHEQIENVQLFATADGQRAAAEYVVIGRYVQTEPGLPPAKGQRYRLAGGAFFTIRDNHIARVTKYYNRQEWLKQISS
jgi:steroid delta-isomerase-like uncharacterized protein